MVVDFTFLIFVTKYSLKVICFSYQVISLELSTGIPMLYIFKEGRFIRRGSPVAPTEASVYAYTKVEPFKLCVLFDIMEMVIFEILLQ